MSLEDPARLVSRQHTLCCRGCPSSVAQQHPAMPLTAQALDTERGLRFRKA